ncbi:MAG: hypothetical protein AUI14_02600 [Actinobacteria bacterium 13_2_20CM_2_71_6]|nr:MAG: hypothetical protein AUI14_02600 [Actinobacteria bacterium 13_2_20CM_2_71_6]
MQHPHTLMDLMWQRQAELLEEAEQRRLAGRVRAARRARASGQRFVRLPWGSQLGPGGARREPYPPA